MELIASFCLVVKGSVLSLAHRLKNKAHILLF